MNGTASFTTGPQTPDRPLDQRPTPAWPERLLVIVTFSLAFAAVGALTSAPLAALSGHEWLLTFAVVRWIGIIALVAYLLVRTAGLRRLPMPAALATPVTILVLMTESVVIDIISARLV